MLKSIGILFFIVMISACTETEHTTICDENVQIRKGGAYYIAHFESELKILPQNNCDTFLLYKNYEMLSGHTIGEGINITISKPDTYAIQPLCLDSMSYANFEYDVILNCDE